MIRSIAAIAVLGLATIFGYYFVPNHSKQSNKDKAKKAIAQGDNTVAVKTSAATTTGRRIALDGAGPRLVGSVVASVGFEALDGVAESWVLDDRGRWKSRAR